MCWRADSLHSRERERRSSTIRASARLISGSNLIQMKPRAPARVIGVTARVTRAGAESDVARHRPTTTGSPAMLKTHRGALMALGAAILLGALVFLFVKTAGID